MELVRTTVREALRILEITGLVETKRGKGTVVTSFDVSSIKKRISDVLIQPGREFDDLMQTRMLLEPEVAKLAAIEASDNKINDLEVIVSEAEKELLSGGVGIDSSIKFHHKIINSINNDILASLTSLIMELVEKITHINLHIPGRAEISLEEHKKILQAIQERKPEDAARSMRVHLESVKNNLKAIVSESSKNQVV